MAAPIITPIPTPPIRSDAPADFAAKADAFAASLPQFVTEVNASAAFVDQRAIDADASATAAAASEAAAEADRAEVAANTATVASNTATVVARADEVAANTLQVAADADQVAADRVAVDAALASIADGPVTSIAGQTGVVTVEQLSSAGVATQAGTETLTNKTFADPIVTLGGSQGVAGQVPVSQGPGLAPVWGEAGGGALILLSTVVADNSATVDMEVGVGPEYDDYVIIFERVSRSGDYSPQVLIKAGGAYLSTGIYRYAPANIAGGGNAIPHLSVNVATGAANNWHAGTFQFFDCNNQAGYKRAITHYMPGANPGSTWTPSLGFGLIETLSAIEGFRFKFASGNVVTGTFRLYGIKKN